MTKRRLYWTAGLVAVLFALPFLLWGGYATVAVLQGQHFYHGLPSGFWAVQVKKCEDCYDWLTLWPFRLRQALGMRIGLNNDPAAVPVLADLLKGDDPELRERAALVLDEVFAYGVDPEARAAAVPALLQTVFEADEPLAQSAARTLLIVKPPSEEVLPTVRRVATHATPARLYRLFLIEGLWVGTADALPLLCQALRCRDAHARNWAVFDSHWKVICKREGKPKVVRLLQEALHDPDEGVRAGAATVLQKLDAEAAAP